MSATDDDGLGPTSGQLPLELRVGVVGHRELHRDDDALADAVASQIRLIQHGGSNPDTAWTTVGFTVVSSLAEGADRIAAHAAMRAGARLEVILPMPVDEYRQDFADDESTESIVEFNELLGKAAHVTTLPPAASRDDAYLAAGQAVVDRSDVVLALWDGAAPRGMGGTGDIVEYAREKNSPLRIIDVDRATGSVRAGSNDEATEIVPYGPLSTDAFAKFDAYNRWVHRSPSTPHSTEFDPAAEGTFGVHIAPFWRGADHAALRFQWRFRLVALLLYVLSATAVSVVAVQLVFDLHEDILWGEFGVLVLLVGVLLYARRAHLLERWTSSRFLAERMRSSLYLAMAGNDYPLGSDDAQREDSDEEWLRRALAEIWYHAPYSPPSAENIAELRVRIAEGWVVHQIEYHTELADRCRGRQHRFSRLAIALFGLSAAAALLHILGLVHIKAFKESLSLISVIVPAIGAAISGYAAQRDYSRQALRSDAMASSLTAALADLRKVVTLVELQHMVLQIDQRMLGDSADWYAGTRVRELELSG